MHNRTIERRTLGVEQPEKKVAVMLKFLTIKNDILVTENANNQCSEIQIENLCT